MVASLRFANHGTRPIRVAVTGTNISPPIFDTLVLLGKDKPLNRIDRCLNLRSE